MVPCLPRHPTPHLRTPVWCSQVWFLAARRGPLREGGERGEREGGRAAGGGGSGRRRQCSVRLGAVGVQCRRLEGREGRAVYGG